MRTSLALFLAALAACRNAAAPEAQEPHQNLDAFTLEQSELGSPAWALKAETAVLKEEKRQALLTRPHMEFFKKSRVVTRLSADGGEINIDTADLHLSGSVVVTSVEDNSVVKTQALDYSSQKKKFFTDTEVVVTRPGGMLRGRGLEANPDLSEIRIFHQTSVVDGQPPQ
ncbi:MAG: LPS export ABC transporter periplasmic protein LptC [Elusimicrobia bacterium]|nr:LPS export ABC transporter periplasmic protein LptC [Elusimicrobiota bacterium]